MPESRVVVIYAHAAPRLSRVNEPLRHALEQLDGVRVRNLYVRYPDFDIDVAAEQAALASAELVVWQYPVHWYAMPSLMKEWLDTVFTHGWAFGEGGTALRGKALLVLLTAGSAQQAYRPGALHGFHFDAFLPPLQQTAALCRMRWLPPQVFHDARGASPEAVSAHIDAVCAALRQFVATGRLPFVEGA
ncbi:NAD(P)H dehydrogenase [Pandoraea thiooxydans]|uniref:NAD(P)H dehydrogenase n=1 Tax=Pandoraea thiooxydans TaxID=445709 RepID=A0A0G3EJH7_9BURK|nr:NAD(P)H-dependent oxidoreductase [Pandoraea thiooxydans]AKJ67080.1 NAD(P)H dehydrogenase [Pandoraea thiooxydans]APR94025.1 NAD(P)H dehydrogenase [Pandoraea thiooxydans]